MATSKSIHACACERPPTLQEHPEPPPDVVVLPAIELPPAPTMGEPPAPALPLVPGTGGEPLATAPAVAV
jgi:hypothetical protein